MSEEPQGSPAPDETPRNNGALVVQERPMREVRVTTDAVPMLDTAKFEHMQRIATIMAETSMIPDALRIGTEIVVNEETGVETKRTVDLPLRRVVANCFMIVNQAVRWDMDPFAVAQCASLVHGRLMWEGKLVAAVIEAKLGIKLRYTFTNDTPDRKIDDRSLGVVVSGRFPGETEDRTVEGTVDRWHKGGKSPWAFPADWKRQLRYMGAREWGRAHAPATMLGVVAVEEADETISTQRTVSKKLAPPPPKAPPEDTGNDQTTTLTGNVTGSGTGDQTITPTGDVTGSGTGSSSNRPVAIKGGAKKAPPPPDAKKLSESALQKELFGCVTEDDVTAFQMRRAAVIAALSEDERQSIIKLIQIRRAAITPDDGDDSFPGDH